MNEIPSTPSGNRGAATLDELRRRHWAAYLALRERHHLASPEERPGLQEQLDRLQEEQQREEAHLLFAESFRDGLPVLPPPSQDTNQEL